MKDAKVGLEVTHVLSGKIGTIVHLSADGKRALVTFIIHTKAETFCDDAVYDLSLLVSNQA